MGTDAGLKSSLEIQVCPPIYDELRQWFWTPDYIDNLSLNHVAIRAMRKQAERDIVTVMISRLY